MARAFLSGYSDGDGFLSNCPEFTTKSPVLASQLTYLFARFGISSTVKTKEVKGATFYRVFVPEQEGKEKLREALSPGTKDTQAVTVQNNVRRTKFGAPALPVST